MSGRPWSREELIFVLKLYCITPFGRIHSRNPEIKAAAEAIGRTPSSVALKMTNFASLDPTIERSGMSNYSKLDKSVWDEFFANMDAYLSLDEQSVEQSAKRDIDEAPAEFRLPTRPGLNVPRLSQMRINQGFFRSLVLASYENKCALTGIEAPELLVASHIVPWSVNSAARTNPTNGICLNALHDKAFDRGLITIDDDLSIRLSPRLPTVTREKLLSFGQKKMRLPARFVPSKEFLDYHRLTVFVAA